jgi:spore coat protein U-like protein
MNGSRLLLLLALLLAGGLLCPSAARAATTCSATMTQLSFSNVDDTGYAIASGTLNWQCETSELFASSPANVKLCFAIAGGGATGSTTAARLMRNQNNDSLSFEIAQDATYVIPWTDSVTPPSSAQVSRSYELTSIFGLFASGSASGTLPVYARVPSQSAAAGSYTNAFTGTQAHLVYRYGYGSSVPASCSSGSTGGDVNVPFTVSATVPGLCRISTASDLDFGSSPGTIAANRDYTSAISMQCRNRTAWNVGLDNGMNALGNTRRMRRTSGAGYVSYELYRNSGRSQRWGKTIGTDTATGTGSGNTQTLTVYGRVPAPQSASPGDYADVVTVTVTY